MFVDNVLTPDAYEMLLRWRGAGDDPRAASDEDRYARGTLIEQLYDATERINESSGHCLVALRLDKWTQNPSSWRVTTTSNYSQQVDADSTISLAELIAKAQFACLTSEEIDGPLDGQGRYFYFGGYRCKLITAAGHCFFGCHVVPLSEMQMMLSQIIRGGIFDRYGSNEE